MVVLVVVSTIDTGKFGLFIQKRVGLNGRLFKVLKIRSMKNPDVEPTRFGKFIRNTKLDELPQLINVLKGDMSLVGPRPDVEGFADKLTGEESAILSLKPGITSMAAIKYFKEEEILINRKDAEFYNKNIIWPDKVKMNLEYVRNWSIVLDLKIIFLTILLSFKIKT